MSNLLSCVLYSKNFTAPRVVKREKKISKSQTKMRKNFYATNEARDSFHPRTVDHHFDFVLTQLIFFLSIERVQIKGSNKTNDICTPDCLGLVKTASLLCRRMMGFTTRHNITNDIPF